MHESELQAAAARPEVRALQSNLAAAARAGDTAALVAGLRDLESRSDLDLIARARLRYQALMHFAQVPESSEARALLEENLVRGPEVHVWHEDGPYQIARPAFAPAAAARFALAEWNRLRWQQLADAGLARGDTAFLDDWLLAHTASGGRLSDAGLVSAFGRSDAASLSEWPTRLEYMLSEGRPVAGLARVVALRMADTHLAMAVIRDADTLSALRMLKDIGRFGDPATETLLLGQAIRREDLASAALYRLAGVPSPQARTLLLSQLASPAHGSSAAAALARVMTPDLVDKLSETVRSQGDMLARRRAVLALRLAREAGGQQALQKLDLELALPADLRSLINRQLP